MKKNRQHISLITLLFCTINIFATTTSNSTEAAIPQPDATIIIKYDESSNGKFIFQSENTEQYYIKKITDKDYTIFITDSIKTINIKAYIDNTNTDNIAAKFKTHCFSLEPNKNIEIYSDDLKTKDTTSHQIGSTRETKYREDFIVLNSIENNDTLATCLFRYKKDSSSTKKEIINVSFTKIHQNVPHYITRIYSNGADIIKDNPLLQKDEAITDLIDDTIKTLRTGIKIQAAKIVIEKDSKHPSYAIYKLEYNINDTCVYKDKDWIFSDNETNEKIIPVNDLVQSEIKNIKLTITQLTNSGPITTEHNITIEKNYTWIIVSGTVLCFLILCFVVVKYLIRYGYIHTTKGTRGQTTEGTEDITGQEPMPQNTPTTEVNDRTTDEKKGITEQEPEPQNTQTTEVNEQQELFNEIKQLATDLGIFIPDTTMSIDIVRLIRKNENETQNKLNKLSNDNGKYQDTLSELKKNIQSYSNDIRVKFEDTDDIVRQTERILRQLKAINSTIDDEIKKNSFELSHSRTGNERLKSVFNEIEKGREILLREQDGKLEELETTHKEEIAKIHQDYKQHDELKDSIINELIKNISDTLQFVMKKLEKILSIATQLRYETSDDSILFDTFRFIPDNIKKIIDEINEIEVTVHNITKEEMLHIPNIVTNKLYEIVEQNIGDNQWIDKTLRLYAFSFTPEINTDFSRRGLDRTLLGDISTNIIALLGRLGVTVNIPQLFTTYNPDVQIQRNDESYLRRYCKLDSIQERIRTLPQGAICDILHIGYTYSKDGEQHTVKAIINYIF